MGKNEVVSFVEKHWTPVDVSFLIEDFLENAKSATSCLPSFFSCFFVIK